MKNVRIFAAVAALIVIIDQWSKHWAVGSLSDGHTVHVVSTLRFNLTFNSGMAFSRGANGGPFIGVLSIIVTIGLVVWQISLSRSGRANALGAVAAGLIVGGAVGNVIDRLFRGEAWLHGRVVDFIDLQWWPVFNVADMGVTLGVVALALSSMRDTASTRSSESANVG